ncbi:MAG: hypothetical protein ACOCXP_03965, partial [Candidatus Dojkabacteria bacterium]
SSDQFGFELPKVSPDNRYVLLEAYTKAALQDYSAQRAKGFQAKPENSSLRVYDLQKGEWLALELAGFNAAWL